MKDINPRASEFAGGRQAIRELCRGFNSQYWQSIEEQSAYPEEFVKALTGAGWLSALIPPEYGGAGHAAFLSVVRGSKTVVGGSSPRSSPTRSRTAPMMVVVAARSTSVVSG